MSNKNANIEPFTRQAELDKILALHAKWLSTFSPYDGVCADLDSMRLAGADLEGADLQHARMSYADLRAANLRHADLRYVSLCGADLRGADLMGARLESASLTWATLDGAKLPPPILDLSNCKVGYKKVWNSDRSEQVVIELRFPEGSRLVSTVIGRKCRASEAVVGRCLTPGHEAETLFWSMHDDEFAYRVGETVRPTKPFDDSITEECTSGIHFFTTREEAEAY